ncbi:hypothetical protein [Pseudoalteromonas tunicata]|uniref:hypothetical protein n=1 Tax=Pseudoalteromonas tunicata TaxID=314281 RepID=UPI0002E40E3E|nr:hypothetical protein [Pseudoalteromonas tunicata]ATC96223.1 hypothetical protein PTUN_a3977 [Pseudoalteromonas tunicata]AXT31739.1 hypothetical protein D1819_13510 [Pseudoalteromonas tunicata]
MKNSIKILSFMICCSVVPFSQAEDIQHNETQIQENIATGAQLIKITPNKMKFALDQFLSMYYGDKEPNLLPLSQYAYEHMTELELTELINGQKIGLANFYGLPVEVLREFENVMAERIADGSIINAKKLSSHHSIQADKDIGEKMTRITVTCKDACGTNLSNNIIIGITIANIAAGAGIGQLEKFVVDFVDNNDTVQVSEFYRYTNTIGGWSLGPAPLPRCSTCHLD